MAEKAKKIDDNFISDALNKWKQSATASAENRDAYIEDVRFKNGHQWPEKTKREREQDGRPCLVVNHTRKFIKQVVGDMRQNRARIKTRPVDSKGDPETAKLIEGLIRNIEYSSRADNAYDWAGECAASGGFGAFRVDKVYADNDAFEMDIRIRRILNPLTVYWDPNAKEPDFSDARHCFVVEDLDNDEFKRRYPKATVGNDFPKGTGDYSAWYSEETTRIAEYWYKESEKRTLYQLEDGRVVYSEDYDAEKDGKPLKTRTVDGYCIYQALITANEALEGPTKWDGRFIPIVQVLGEEDFVDGKIVYTSVIRHAKGPQQMYNFWMSSITETVGLAPKAPWMVTPKQIGGHENQWGTAHRKTYPYLLYNPDPANGNAPPQRTPPIALPTGAFNLAQICIDDMKATTGLFDASLGAKSNEASGKAILARQREGDVATYAFIDNLAKAIAHAGRIVLDLIPKVYDTTRIVRILNYDGTDYEMPINYPAQDAIELVQSSPERFKALKPADIQAKIATDRPTVLNDLTVGKYDVVVETGPSYSTQRAESAEAMISMAQADPMLMQIAGDKVYGSMDWPEASEIAERYKKLLTATKPFLMEGEEADGKPVQPPAPPPPSPEMELEAKKMELENKKLDVENKKVDVEAAKVTGDAEAFRSAVSGIVLEKLSELHAPEHPADQMLMEGM